MRFRFERLKRLGPITSSITAARLRVFTQPRPTADFGPRRFLRGLFGISRSQLGSKVLGSDIARRLLGGHMQQRAFGATTTVCPGHPLKVHEALDHLRCGLPTAFWSSG